MVKVTDVPTTAGLEETTIETETLLPMLLLETGIECGVEESRWKCSVGVRLTALELNANPTVENTIEDARTKMIHLEMGERFFEYAPKQLILPTVTMVLADWLARVVDCKRYSPP